MSKIAEWSSGEILDFKYKWKAYNARLNQKYRHYVSFKFTINSSIAYTYFLSDTEQ